jgi:hypothetical protein
MKKDRNDLIPLTCPSLPLGEGEKTYGVRGGGRGRRSLAPSLRNPYSRGSSPRKKRSRLLRWQTRIKPDRAAASSR